MLAEAQIEELDRVYRIEIWEKRWTVVLSTPSSNRRLPTSNFQNNMPSLRVILSSLLRQQQISNNIAYAIILAPAGY